MTAPASLEALLDRVRSGESTALEELFRNHKPALVQAVRYALGPRHVARPVVNTDDVMQSVLVRLALEAKKAGPPGRGGGGGDKIKNGFVYLKIIALRLVIGRYRRRLPGRLQPLTGDVEGPAADPAAVAAWRDEYRALIDLLPPGQRALAESRKAEKTWGEIAGPDSGKVERAFQRRIAEIVRLHSAAGG